MHVEMEALVALTTEKGMSLEQLIQAIEAGVLTAYNETAEPNRYAQAKLNRETGEIQIIIPEFNEMGERIAYRHVRFAADVRPDSFKPMDAALAETGLPRLVKQHLHRVPGIWPQHVKLPEVAG